MITTCSIVPWDKVWFFELPLCPQLSFQCANDQLKEKQYFFMFSMSQKQNNADPFMLFLVSVFLEQGVIFWCCVSNRVSIYLY